jgi:hypothetical protein
VAPYHPTGEALEIDAQIQDFDAPFHGDEAYGIAVGMDDLGAGYACGETLNQPIASVPGWDESSIQGETRTGVYGNTSHYVTMTVIIQNNVITLSYDGQLAAQATATTYHTNGSIGLFSASSAKVRGFRIEDLS